MCFNMDLDLREITDDGYYQGETRRLTYLTLDLFSIRYHKHKYLN